MKKTDAKQKIKISQNYWFNFYFTDFGRSVSFIA